MSWILGHLTELQQIHKDSEIKSWHDILDTTFFISRYS